MTFSRAVELGLPKKLQDIIPRTTLDRVNTGLDKMKDKLAHADQNSWRSQLHAGNDWLIFITKQSELYCDKNQEDITWDLRNMIVDTVDIGNSTTSEGYFMPLDLQTGAATPINKKAIQDDLRNHPNESVARQMAGLGAEEPYETRRVCLIAPPHKGCLNAIKEWDELQRVALDPNNNYLGKRKYDWLPL